jgi:transposase-like protein
MTGEAIDAVSRAFGKALIERILGAELSHHLGYEPGGEQLDGQGNCRNGVGHKTLRMDTGAIRLEVPRDRDGPASRPCSCPNTRGASPASTTRSSPCAPGA